MIHRDVGRDCSPVIYDMTLMRHILEIFAEARHYGRRQRLFAWNELHVRKKKAPAPHQAIAHAPGVCSIERVPCGECSGGYAERREGLTHRLVHFHRGTR
jgi:hypothetical protein